MVIGNPPYGASLSKKEKKYFDSYYETTQYNYDTYCFFFEKSFLLLKKGGYLGYITPNTFLVVELGDKLRRFLFERYNLLRLLEAFNVFSDAVVEPIVSIFQNERPVSNNVVEVYLSNRENSSPFSNDDLTKIDFNYNELFEEENLIFNYRATKPNRILSKRIKNISQRLSEIAKVSAGVILYEKGKGTPSQTAETLRIKPYTGFEKKNDSWLKLIRGSDVQRYNLNWSGEYVLYGENLAAPRKKENFFKNKLIVRRTDDNLMFSHDDESMIGVKSIHCIQPFNKEINEKFLLSILNSKLLNWFFRFENFHMIGKPFAEVKLVYVERLPIKIFHQQQAYIDKADIILSKNKELNQLLQQFTQLLLSKFATIIINNKLQNWANLTSNEFFKELKKQKIKLPLSEQQEWLQYFEEEKIKANDIQQVIQQTDKEIDKMVYELYELSEEEVRIVEGK